VRAEGDENSESLGKLRAGEQVEVLQINSATGWVLIKHKKNQGYMQDDNLQFQLMG